MVNDRPFRKANCKMKKLGTERAPKLCLFAVKDIPIGDELTYDYGVTDQPWRHLKVS